MMKDRIYLIETEIGAFCARRNLGKTASLPSNLNNENFRIKYLIHPFCHNSILKIATPYRD